MSKILSDVLANASVDFTMRIPSSERDKVRAQLKDNEELLNIYLPALLIADEDHIT